MAESATVSFNLEPEIKEKAESLLNPLGMDLATVFNYIVRQIVMERSLPLGFNPDSDVERSIKAFNAIRERAATRGYMTDDEINAEIKAARQERKERGRP